MALMVKALAAARLDAKLSASLITLNVLPAQPRSIGEP